MPKFLAVWILNSHCPVLSLIGGIWLFLKCFLLDLPAPWEHPGLPFLPSLPCSWFFPFLSSSQLQEQPWLVPSESLVPLQGEPSLPPSAWWSAGGLPSLLCAFLVSRALGHTFCGHCRSCSWPQSSPDGSRVYKVCCALLLGASCKGPANWQAFPITPFSTNSEQVSLCCGSAYSSCVPFLSK